jgi:acid phosphatase
VNRRAFLTGLLVLPPALRAWAGAERLRRYAVIGDWGTGGSLQRTVAKGMDRVAQRLPLDAVWSTGDNIYPNGVTSADDPQWSTKFERIYDLPALRSVPWYAVLGNHDHRQSIQAQIDRGTRDPRWHMPARWFSHEEQVDEVTKICVVGLDTQPLLQGDPVMHQQLAWAEETLRSSTAQWKVVVGHHPIRSYGHYGDQSFMLRHVKPLLDAHKVNIYACGHDHDLQVIKHPDDGFVCAVSGGGGGSRPTTRGEHSRYAASNGGFMTFTARSASLTVDVYDANGTQTFTTTA